MNAYDLEPHLAEIALHFSTAAPAGTRAKAIEYARRAGDRAVSLLAYEEAVRLYRLALASVEHDADRATCCSSSATRKREPAIRRLEAHVRPGGGARRIASPARAARPGRSWLREQDAVGRLARRRLT